MGKCLQIKLLPAGDGDCIWISCRSNDDCCTILIDGGRLSTLQHLREHLAIHPENIDLLVLTHVDADHLEGAIALLAEPTLARRIGDVWFNGYSQISHIAAPTPSEDTMRSPQQGDFISALIRHRGMSARVNGSSSDSPLLVPDSGELPRIPLAAGVVITLLSPGAAQLQQLRVEWQSSMRKKNRRPGDLIAALRDLAGTTKYGFSPQESANTFRGRNGPMDSSIANGSSLAFLLEFEGASALLLGDAHENVIWQALARLATERGTSVHRFDAVKLSHHGSRANISHRLLQSFTARHYLISTDGSVHGHPDSEAIALLAEHLPAQGATLHFNYASACRSEIREIVENAQITLSLPASADAGCVLELLDTERTAS